jgi:hypothetical protein
MTSFLQAVKLMKQGKEVRCTNWEDGSRVRWTNTSSDVVGNFEIYNKLDDGWHTESGFFTPHMFLANNWIEVTQ